jgi:hypothetical protein
MDDSFSSRIRIFSQKIFVASAREALTAAGTDENK